MKILAIIPARGGSKGIPNKNIIDLNGKPLIYYTICEALKITGFNRVLVSTDSVEIKRISESFGLEVPFLRPEYLGGDSVRTIDVVIDVLDTLKGKYNEEFDYICLLQPISPLRTAKDITNCIKLIKKTGGNSVVSLSKVDEPHPHKMKKIKSGLVYPFIKGTTSSIPRQELPEVYNLNGAVYITDEQTIIKKRSLFGKKTYPYIMPDERSVNINNPNDLLLAEALLAKVSSD